MGRPKDRLRGLFLLAITLITILSAGAYYLSQALTAKSDVFYLHYLGYRLFEPDRAEKALKESVSNAAGQEEELRRRELSSANYPLSSIGHYLGTVSFPGNLTLAVAVGLFAPFLAGVCIFALGCFRVPDMCPPAALAVAVMAMTGFLPGPGATDHLLFHDGLEKLLNLVVLVVSPGEAFSPLSIWPKSSVALIVLATMCCRWNGYLGTGYVLTLASMLFHLTLGGLLLLSFTVIDRVFRPERIPVAWSALAASASIAALAFGQWRIILHGDFVLPVILVGILLLSAVLLLRYVDIGHRAASIMHLDIALFVFAASVMTATGMLLLATSGAETILSSPVSIFGQLAARLIVLSTTVLLLAMALHATQWLKKRHADAAVPAVALFACLLAIYGACGSWWWESRFIPARLHEIHERAQTEPLTAVYYQALLRLGATSGTAR